jgi:protein-tyrosine phosphatase
MTILDAPRLLPLEGGFNLRDLGGYAARNGRAVRRGMLYRSGMMSMLTEADERYLGSLGIATVCDFRRPGERRAEPTRWCEPAGVHYWARDYSETTGVLAKVLRGEGLTADDVRSTMIRLYPELLVDHAPSYRYMFERLLDGKAPLLFNCTVGKDRTGVAAALILTALDVPYETVLEDYVETNRHADFSRLMAREGRDGQRFRAMERAVLAPLFAADPDYLAAMFDSLGRDHGGVDQYLAGLGVDGAARERLQDLLLA